MPLIESLRKHRFVRAAACAFFLFHLSAITIENIPRSAFDGMLRRPLEAYVRFAGLSQRWDMFSTIPYFLDIQGAIVARDEQRKETRYSPFFPGGVALGNVRMQALLLRLSFLKLQYPDAGERYLRSACREVSRRAGRSPVSVGLELRTLRLRRLADIRKDGRMVDGKIQRFEEVPCPH